MDLPRSLMVHFLILCFIGILEGIEIVTLKTKGLNKTKTQLKDKIRIKEHKPKDVVAQSIDTQILDIKLKELSNKLANSILMNALEKSKNQRSSHKKVKNNLSKEIENFINKYRIKMEKNGSLIRKVEMIEGTKNDSKADRMEIHEIYSAEPCQTNPCHPQAICISIGHTSYSCSCPPGYTATQTDTDRLYNTQRRGRVGKVCRKVQTGGEVTGKKSYKGTLKGGLKLKKDSEEMKHEPLVGVVDDLIENEEIDVEAMIKEHFREPKHFGIHLSGLETLHPDRVKEDHRDRSIIANMF